MTALILGMLFILLTILLTAASINTAMIYTPHPRCVQHRQQHGNKTIHLVHENIEWTPEELDILKYVIDVYPDYDIHILNFEKNNYIPKKTEKNHIIKIIVDNDNITKSKTTTKREITTEKSESNKLPDEDLYLFENPFKQFNPYSFIAKLKTNLKTGRYKRSVETENKVDTLDNLTKKYKNIKLENTTYKTYFHNTPLQFYWTNLDKNMLVFITRIEELWQYGGLSFQFPSKLDNSTQSNSTYITNLKSTLKNVVLNSKSLYDKLNNDLVSVDGKGYHVGTKIACHAFFDEMISKLIKQTDISVPTLIRETLDTFCKRGAVDSDYCKNIQY